MVCVQSHQKINVKLNIIISKITAFLFFIISFTKQAISSSFERGMDAANEGDFTTALKEWKPLAEDGHAMAQLSLGFVYLDGEGVPQDNQEAEKWL